MSERNGDCGHLGDLSAIFLENNSSMTSQLSLNVGILRTGDHIFELKTKPTVRKGGRKKNLSRDVWGR